MEQSWLELSNLTTLLADHPWFEPLFNTFVYENSIGAYMMALIVILFVKLCAHIIVYILERHARRLAKRTSNRLDDVVLTIIHRSVVYVSVLTALYFSVRSLNFPETVDLFFQKFVFVLFVFKIAKESKHFVEFVVKQYLEPYARRQKSFGSTMVIPISRFAGFIIWSSAALLVISNLGYDITSLITGLGLGGLAFALAAQEMLSNTFGSLSVLMDQAFKVGDLIQVNGQMGKVIEVGMRSTKIQTLEKNIVTIPNKIVAAEVIENISERNMFLVELTLGLTYDTDSKQVQSIVSALRKVLKRHKHVDTETVRVHFLGFGDSALEVNVSYYITDVSSYNRILDLNEEIHLKLYSQIEKIGADLAFPTQTLNLNHENLPKQTTRRKKANK